MLWKDLIEIPQTVHRGDFVLKLSEGVDHADQTIGAYVVTEGLATAFDAALSLIRDAVSRNSSSAAYLHGSFGSGKSHFMAVLNLLLADNPTAKSLPGLSGTIAKHDWMFGKKFLMVPFHMVGARDMESAILGGYVEYVRRHHPDASLPGVYLGESILANAQQLRGMMGDEKFFEALNKGQSTSKWGRRGWDPETFDAVANDPNTARRPELIGDLVSRVLTSVRVNAEAGAAEGFVSLDQGLEIVSQHAKGLGYDGLILFLDELILWLASRAGDTEFVHTEGQKLAKLVEAQNADRPIPIVSFVARQRNLGELVGRDATGSEQASFNDSLEWWEGRFDVITLEDRNLPAIVAGRLLKPRSGEAKEQVEQSFARTFKQLADRDRDILFNGTSGEVQFRQVYPFSPVLMDTLVALSSVLQRERTALRLLLTLLVRNRESLALGQIIPVGDLWDVVAEGEEPFSETLRQPFRAAKKLWETKLKPMLRESLGFDSNDANLTDDQIARVEALRSDELMLKTLLLAALVPGVRAFEGLTAKRLNALNYGAVRTPFRGQEHKTILASLRNWASQHGEIRIGDEDDPRVSIQLTEIDIESILERVAEQDTYGSRKRLVRELLFGWLGLANSNEILTKFAMPWRGTTRHVNVRYENVRELRNEQLVSHQGWTLVLDYPFDDTDFSPMDDSQRLEDFLSENPTGTQTIAWLPRFLNTSGQNLLGKLVKTRHVLAHFDAQVQHIAPEERGIVRAMLDNTHSVVRTQLQRALEVAYGLSHESIETVDTTHNLPTHLVSLDPAWRDLHLPGGQSFEQTLRRIATQAFGRQHPQAPNLPDEEIRISQVEKLWLAIEGSIQNPDHRFEVSDKPLRAALKAIAEPLQLGNMGETHFAHHVHWRNEFEKRVGLNGDVTVGQLRAVIDPPTGSTGVPILLQNLMVRTFAAIEDLQLLRHGQALDFRFNDLSDGDVLRRPHLPAQHDWNTARTASAALFGLPSGEYLSVANVQRLGRAVAEQAQGHISRVKQLEQNLQERMKVVGVEPRNAARYGSTVELHKLLKALHGEPVAVVEALAKHWPGDHGAVLAKTLQDASNTNAWLSESARWRVFETVAKLPSDAATGLLNEVREVLTYDETVRPLITHLDRLHNRALELLTSLPPGPGSGTGTGPGPISPPVRERISVTSHADLEALVAKLKAAIDQGKTVNVEWSKQ